jgi:hypothetical protein
MPIRHLWLLLCYLLSFCDAERPFVPGCPRRSYPPDFNEDLRYYNEVANKPDDTEDEPRSFHPPEVRVYYPSLLLADRMAKSRTSLAIFVGEHHRKR